MDLDARFERIAKDYRSIIYTSDSLTNICSHVLACINGNYPIPAREEDKIKVIREFKKILDTEKKIRNWQIDMIATNLLSPDKY